MKKIIVGILVASTLLMHAINGSDKRAAIDPKFCMEVLAQSNLNDGTSEESVTPNVTHEILKSFFAKHKIHDYADAAQFGRQNDHFANPNTFNTFMMSFFVENNDDIAPHAGRRYQAVLFNTSGIDVFMERLALMARLVKKGLKAEALIALVGTHAHRDDLRQPPYLTELPTLFAQDFDLSTYDQDVMLKQITQFLEKKSWTHRDGMEVAWRLISSDPVMAELYKRFSFFEGTGRTEELLRDFLKENLKKPITTEDPIAFVGNAQGAAKLKEMIKKILPHHSDSVDLLIARMVPEEIETKLFNDTPQQRAMVKLFHFYRILEVIA